MSDPDPDNNENGKVAGSELREVELYTDGACSGNPGPGGWAFILRDRLTKKEKESSGGESETTNNQMEMRAVIEGLKTLKRRCKVHLFSDSSYVLNGLKSWVVGWKKNGWRRKDGKKWEPVKNVELWIALEEAASHHEMVYHHVKGHSGHIENERCDELAVAASKKYY